jgi:DNA-binding transcriptional ArsR family regulator
VTAAAERLDSALRALADANRRTILGVIRDRARPVGEIAEKVAMSQQAVSHHLSVLRGAGLVTEQREGTRHLYAVRADGLGIVQDYLGGFWPAQLTNLKRAAEKTARSRRDG